MEYRRLGKAGVKVSALSFGSWVTFGDQIGDDVAESLMIKAYEGGINFFDNAEGYARGKSELVMGKILKKLNWPRDTWLVSSKVYFGAAESPQKPNQTGLSRKHVFEACHAALRRLQVDYLDFFFCHRPDPETPVEETVWAMHNIIESGRALYWGTSEWSATAILDAWQIADKHNLHKPVVEQPQYNLLEREKVEKEFADLYDSIGLGLTTWSPLASGLLTGKYLDGVPSGSRATLPGYQWMESLVTDAEANRKTRALQPIASELGVTSAQLAIAWCASNPHVSTVITGASRVEQLRENLAALEVLPRLTPDVLRRVDDIF